VTNQYFTPGSYAAGATADYKNAHVTGMVAWYGANAGGRAQSVGQKVPTSIGLYDISGNVWEWCYEDSGQEHIMRGGSWRDGSSYLQIGSLGDFPRPDPVTPNPDDPSDPNYHGIDLTDLTPIPGVTPTPVHSTLPSTLPDSQRYRTPRRQWLLDTYGYDPADPSDPSLPSDPPGISHYDPMLDPNLSDINTLKAYLTSLGISVTDSTTMNDALLKYFNYWGSIGGYGGFNPTDSNNFHYTSSTTPPPKPPSPNFPYYDPRLAPLYPYNKDYATRYDFRFDPRNPQYDTNPDFIEAREGYDDDTGRKGNTIGFRIVRNQ
jgi:hypothetical protein